MQETCAQGLDTSFIALGYSKVAVLGVVQGITELMPISSTAHMRIVPALLGWPDPGSAFSAAMQLAALAAVVSYFWVDVESLAVGAGGAVIRRDWGDRRLRLVFWIGISTIPIILAGWGLSPVLNECNSPLRSLYVIGASSIVMALLLAMAEMMARHVRTLQDVKLTDALTIGIGAGRRLDPGRVTLRFDVHRGSLPGPETCGSGPLLLLAWPASHHARRAGKNFGNSTRSISVPMAGPCSRWVLPPGRSRHFSRSGGCFAF